MVLLRSAGAWDRLSGCLMFPIVHEPERAEQHDAGRRVGGRRAGAAAAVVRAAFAWVGLGRHGPWGRPRALVWLTPHRRGPSAKARSGAGSPAG
jgi:hypothetical protein